ncbi:hypothetical protein C7S15_8043 [Burkholderia cepacia]|nr:hypothetical protein [Burkholderia cepacia]
MRDSEGSCGILSQQRAPVTPAGVAAVDETFFMKSTRTIYTRACSLHPNALALRVSKRVRPFAEDENRKWHHQFPPVTRRPCPTGWPGAVRPWRTY